MYDWRVCALQSFYICPMMKIVLLSGAYLFLFFRFEPPSLLPLSPSSNSLLLLLLLYLLLLLLLLLVIIIIIIFFIGFGRGGGCWYSYYHIRCWMAFNENHMLRCRWYIIAMRSEGLSLILFFPLKVFIHVLVPEVLFSFWKCHSSFILFPYILCFI